MRESGLSVDYMLETVFGRRRREREAAEAVECSETSAKVGGSRSSNKMEGEEEEEKEEKKLPKTSSSTSSRRVVGVEGKGMHDQVEFAEEVTTEYVQRADVLITHTAVYDTLHASP